MEKEITVGEAIVIFKTRINELSRYKGITEDAIRKIKDEKLRGVTRLSVSTLKLNEMLLNTHMECINNKVN